MKGHEDVKMTLYDDSSETAEHREEEHMQNVCEDTRILQMQRDARRSETEAEPVQAEVAALKVEATLQLQYDRRFTEAKEPDWEAIRAEAELVFGLVASLNADEDKNTMSKAELIKAHNGDFKLFEQLDGDSDGRVTLDEWHTFLERKHMEKGDKGDVWLRSVFHTLRKNAEIDSVILDIEHNNMCLPDTEGIVLSPSVDQLESAVGETALPTALAVGEQPFLTRFTS